MAQATLASLSRIGAIDRFLEGSSQWLIILGGRYWHNTVDLWLGMHPILGVVLIPMTREPRTMGFDFGPDLLTHCLKKGKQGSGFFEERQDELVELLGVGEDQCVPAVPDHCQPGAGDSLVERPGKTHWRHDIFIAGHNQS